MKPNAAPASKIKLSDTLAELSEPVAAPINAEEDSRARSNPGFLRLDARNGAGSSSAPNELLALARSWDLWGGAAFVLFVVWMAVSSVFSIT